MKLNQFVGCSILQFRNKEKMYAEIFVDLVIFTWY